MTTPFPTDIVLIEDGQILRGLLTEWLESAGYQVRKAEDGSVGLAAVRFAQPALVITDMQMPVMDGWAVLAEIRERHAAVPVVPRRARCKPVQ